MKPQHLKSHLGRLLFVAAGFLSVSYVNAQSTAFNYQGRLNDGGVPANGRYDLKFALYDSTNLVSGNLVAGPVTYPGIDISNGLFTVTLDFGAVFPGAGRVLDIAVRTNGGAAFTALAPRQPITSEPYAIMAGSASTLLGTLPATQVTGTLALAQLPAVVLTNNAGSATLSGAFAGNGAGLTNLNAGNLAGGTVPLPRLPAVVVTNGATGVSLNNLNAGGGLYLPWTSAGTGVVYFGGTPTLHTYGNANCFFGPNAGNRTLTGESTVGVGSEALVANTSGSWNTAVGFQALTANTNGYDNTAVGNGAMRANTSGYYNAALGAHALDANTTGIHNTAVGNRALYANRIGSENIAVGYQAGYYPTNSNNIHIGNVGLATDAGVIRIGTPGTHGATYLAGTVNGDGGGLTNVSVPAVGGLFVKHIVSTDITEGALVALGTPDGTIQLQRDGITGYGFKLVIAPGPIWQDIAVASTGITRAGAPLNFYTTVQQPSGIAKPITVVIYSGDPIKGNTNYPVHFDCSFGNVSGGDGQWTQVSLTADQAGRFAGTLTSTFRQ